MEYHIREVNKEATIITEDSGEWETTSLDYLPGGLVNIFLTKCSSLVDNKKVVKSCLGNWMAISLEHKGKRLEIINIYRLPSTSSNGVCCSLTQYNRIDGKMNPTSIYRKEILDEIRKHIRENLQINDIIIGGDYNQYIGDKDIRKFHDDIDVYKIHHIINKVQIN